jgi:hypothetical protein
VIGRCTSIDSASPRHRRAAVALHGVADNVEMGHICSPHVDEPHLVLGRVGMLLGMLEEHQCYLSSVC